MENTKESKTDTFGEKYSFVCEYDKMTPYDANFPASSCRVIHQRGHFYATWTKFERDLIIIEREYFPEIEIEKEKEKKKENYSPRRRSSLYQRVHRWFVGCLCPLGQRCRFCPRGSFSRRRFKLDCLARQSNGEHMVMVFFWLAKNVHVFLCYRRTS